MVRFMVFLLFRCVRLEARRVSLGLVACAIGLAVAGCAGTPARPLRSGYVAVLNVTRLKDHSALASASLPLALGQKAVRHARVGKPTEDTPVFPTFAATLQTTRTPGVYQVVTRVSIREAARNKKGKLKYSKRDEGALLPVRLGETQLASTAADPIQIDIRVERR